MKLTPAERIRRHVDFQRIYEQGVKVHGRYCSLFVLPNDVGVGRLGITATRKIGGAVRRNRAKRLIREVFRRNKSDRFDVVVVARRELVDATLTVLEREYRTLLDRSTNKAAPQTRLRRGDTPTR